MDKGDGLDQAVRRLDDALERLTPGTPEYEALWPEYEAAYRAWDEYHQTECPICRRIDKQLREMAHN